MYGRYHFILERQPLKRLVYSLLGGPRISDWMRFWSVDRALQGMELPAAPRIIDAGCGRGFYSLMLAERFPEGRVTAVDEDPALIAMLQDAVAGRPGMKIEAVRSDLLSFSPDRPCDLLCCVDVMEHIADDSAAFGRFARWLRPGGYLVMHVPQSGQRFQFLKRTHGREGDPHRREGYRPAALGDLARKTGLTPVAMAETIGRLAGLAVELDELLWHGHLYPVWMAAYPLLMTVAAGDALRSVSKGQGILLVARKSG